MFHRCYWRSFQGTRNLSSALACAMSAPARVPQLPLSLGETTVPAPVSAGTGGATESGRSSVPLSARLGDPASAPGSPGFVPGPTPRRRISAAIRLDAEFISKDSSVRSSPGPATARDSPADGEDMVKRVGKKINGRYALISVFVARARIRLVVYFQVNCQKHELICTINESDFPVEDVERRGELISRMLVSLQLDTESNKPMLGSDIPVTWVTK